MIMRETTYIIDRYIQTVPMLFTLKGLTQLDLIDVLTQCTIKESVTVKTDDIAFIPNVVRRTVRALAKHRDVSKDNLNNIREYIARLAVEFITLVNALPPSFKDCPSDVRTMKVLGVNRIVIVFITKV